MKLVSPLMSPRGLITVAISFLILRSAMGYTFSSHWRSPVALYISYAATTHIMRSVEMGHAPPDPVSWII